MTITNLSFEALQETCEAQTALYLDRKDKKITVDLGHCYEIVRRAITEKSDVAWGILFNMYEPQMRQWILGNSRFHYCNDEVEDSVNEIFWKFFRVMVPNKLPDFDKSIPALLQYLKMTCFSYIMNCARKVEINRVQLHEGIKTEGQGRPERDTTQKELSAELINVIQPHLRSRKDVLIFDCIFRRNMKSKEIAKRYSADFKKVSEVYRATENLKQRLLRDKKLQELSQHGGI